MADIKSSDFHADYSEMHRHWDSRSERYAGGDALITAISNGWRLMEPLFEQEYWHSGMRRISVLHATLERSGERMIMPVLANPFISRGLRNRVLDIRPYKEFRKDVDLRESEVEL
ncbi:MAG TPA: hypothetical protein VER79_12915 [Candidatus Limnocylindrales bacterium]|nr:hypothetical protein [Candidatus Limnocylindrales bacterium]